MTGRRALPLLAAAATVFLYRSSPDQASAPAPLQHDPAPNAAPMGHRIQLRVPAKGTTVVSLTFDDGTADHDLARRILDARGLKATFYVNSAQLGRSGYYMTLAEARAIQAGGHEIGGHTLDHLNLTTLSPGERRRQICEDRDQLLRWGFDPIAFAYPFGAHDAPTRTDVRACGYRNARAVGGVATCPSCRKTESPTSHDPYAIETPDSIKSDTTLEDLRRLVTDAEDDGGGWLVLVFHKVCDGCDRNAVAPGTLADFLDWLRARAANGTWVATVGQMSGPGGLTGLPPAPGPPGSASRVRVFPNPWRADRHGSLPVTFSGLTPGSVVRLFTVSGRHLRSLSAPNGTAAWDLAERHGDGVSSGYVAFVATDAGGREWRGVLAVVK
ncbi:MAG: polysaccharide deacetylase family protein [Elusimicrobia bacterium]|nr:polysaccharide deacetylase family protein [Elusimicrobiota bacterium]